MKQNILLWAFTLIVSSFSFSAQAIGPHPNYNISPNEITWQGSPIAADPKTFEILGISRNCNDCGFPYARDKNHVFYNGKILDEADSASFRLFGEGFSAQYSKDAKHVYENGKLVPDADAESFDIAGDNQGFAHDKLHAFHGPQSFPLSTYKKLGPATVIGTSVFWATTEIIGADPATYEALEYGYGRDKNAVYASAEKLPQFDPASFRVINSKFLADKTGVYSGYVNLPNQGGQSNYELLSPIAGHNVRTIDKNANPDLYKVCNLLYHTAGHADPDCCRCVRDDTTLFAFVKEKPLGPEELETMPLNEVRINGENLIFRNTTYGPLLTKK